ncbi:T9SS type A sorting domain-containing protein [uncultured Barnesiella sp.]|uniref:InlB B-repeat-containing protein n=1 Tax=uncultured Barnesiella sp. TaxID=584861 RepID=UPI0026288EC7|nr:T9SS type A sorting domain-containing protein [uncultured Barnesiella sp.]
MKKFTSFLFSLCLVLGVSEAWGEIKITTSLELGSEFTFYPSPVASDGKVIVDWGDGVRKEYTVDGMWTRSVSDNQVGDTIRILSPMRSFDCSEAHVTSLSIVNEPELTTLDCYRNEIERTNLDISGAPNLETLNCYNNPKLMFLNLSEHKKLRNLDCRYDKTDASNPDDRGGITTIILPSEGSALESITAYNNDLSAIDLSGCPNLYYINLEGNALAEIDVTKLAELQQLDIRYNYIQSIDLTQNAKLEKLFCNDNYLTELNVFANTALMDLVCSNNQLTRLDLTGNSKITNLSCDGNQLTKLNVSNMSNLLSLKCGDNLLTEIDLSQNTYLTRFWGPNNLFTYLDFYYNQGINTIDIRNNKGMTPCSLNYMYQTLSGLESASPYPNLLLEGSNAETSDTYIATESKWTVDVTGDGSATCGTVTATIVPSELGTFTLSQPDLVTHELHAVENNQLESGVPTYITASPAEGYQVRYYEVNGQRINSNIFAASENVTVSAVFIPIAANNYIAMEVENNVPFSFGISGIDPETEVEIDWGNGEIETMTIDNESIVRLDGNSKGTTIRISGLIDYFDCSENDLISLDVTHNATLATLDCYWTGITSLDLSKNPELGKLDCSYNEIGTLDLSKNTKLFSLTCYDCELTSIDLSNNTELEEAVIRNNSLSSVTLANNTKLMLLDVQNNSQLSSIDVSMLSNLQELQCSNMGLTSLDVTHNTQLVRLTCSNNALTTLDLSANTELERLFCDGNQLEPIDLSNNTKLNYIECSGNSMTACELNDLFYHLPVCATTPTNVNLFIAGINNANEAETSETSIATKKGWKVSIDGDGSGCNEAYITIEPSENGSLELRNENNEVVNSGDKVAKNSTVTITALPDEGYLLRNVKVNGVSVSGSFVVKMASVVTAEFADESAIDETETAGVKVWSLPGILRIVADDAAVQVYTTSGSLVWEGRVINERDLNLNQGIYIVKVHNTLSTQSKKVIVK